MPNKKSQRVHTQIDVAIVGAGCSGLYCGWRLATGKRTTGDKIYIFEKEHRVGGRLLSVDLLSPLVADLLPEAQRKAELGGMRLTSAQLLVNKLIARLKQNTPEMQLAHRSYNPLALQPYTFNTRLMYLGGTRLDRTLTKWPRSLDYKVVKRTDYDLKTAAVTIAKDALRETLTFMQEQSSHAAKTVPDGWQKSTATLLEPNNLKRQALTASQWRDWQENARFNKDHIFNVGLYGLLKDTARMSAKRGLRGHLALDTQSFLRDALGYQSLIADANAAQAIPIFLADFGDPVYSTLAGGMDALPSMLAYHCRLNGCAIAKSHEVKSITLIKSTKEFELLVESSEPVTERTAITKYRAKQVILALPTEALKQITFHNFSTEDVRQFTERLGHVTPHHAVKIFLRYDKPWWTDLSVDRDELENGENQLEARAITTLDIRQVYYYGDQPNKPAFIMGYCDDDNAKYWISDIAPRSPKETDLLHALGLGGEYLATRRVIDHVEDDLKTIHGRDIPTSSGGLIRKWDGAWHFWNTHVKPWEEAKAMIQPFGSLPLFTCGEAYSLEQGWVEGALKSAERVVLEMGSDSWIDDGECGPANCDSVQEYISH